MTSNSQQEFRKHRLREWLEQQQDQQLYIQLEQGLILKSYQRLARSLSLEEGGNCA